MITIDSFKSSNVMAVPRSISFIAILVGTLALFLFITSQFLVAFPIRSTVHGYLVGVDRSEKPLVVPLTSNASEPLIKHSGKEVVEQESVHGYLVGVDRSEKPLVVPLTSNASEPLIKHSGKEVVEQESVLEPFTNVTQGVGAGDGSVSPKGSGTTELVSGVSRDVGSADSGNLSASSNVSSSVVSLPTALPESSRIIDSESCDLYQGKWIYDPAGPLYTNNTCPMITATQNCQSNGRPDRDYENWRWKPDQCDLPRFDGRKFLELMRGKTLAFIGDSVARNQMESLICMLWQVEVPKNRGSRRMQRWFFRSTSTYIARIWSSWLVHKTDEEFDFAPKGIVKVHLDLPDEDFMEFLPRFDVAVLSSGHWFAKQSAYILNGKLVGGQLWWPKEAGTMQINSVEAFSISVETTLTSIAAHPNFSGLAIVRSYSPDHYEGGAWNTGGSCTGKVKPAKEVVRNGFTDVMHEKQVTGFQKAVQKVKAGSKLRLMDITEPFSYRHDGHPGPYRSTDPNKVTKRGPDGKPPPQDCLHWCMPGPVDTWNEILFEIIRREYNKS